MQKTSSLSSKIITIITASLIGVSVLIYFVSSGLLLKSYAKIESDQMTQNVQRAEDAITNTVIQLNVKLTDWAWWDDTYAFINDKDEAYIESNLGMGSISNLKINTMVFVNTSGEIVFKKLIDFKTKTELSSESIGAHVQTHKSLIASTKESNAQGIIILKEGPMVLASLPILPSEADKEFQGTLMFGKFLDADLIDDLEKLTHLSIDLYAYDSTDLPDDVMVAKNKLLEQDQIITEPRSKTVVAGYTVINDIYNKPVFVLKIETPREVYSQGLKTLYSFIFMALGSIFGFGIIIIMLIEFFFVSRFALLSKEMRHIGETKDFKGRVTEGKKDEIGLLALGLNEMLDSLVVSREAEKESGEKTVVAEQKLNERVEELEKMNKLMVDRELKMIELKKEIETLKTSQPQQNS